MLDMPTRLDDDFARATALAAAGDRLGAIGLAVRHGLGAQAAEFERAQIEWRFRGFDELDRTAGLPSWPPAHDDPAPGTEGLLEVTRDRLDARMLGGAIVNHGSLCVRGLLGAAEAEEMRHGIDATFAARDAYWAGTATPAEQAWYTPFDWSEVSARGSSRSWSESQGSIWAVDSPRMIRRLIEMFERHGVIDTIAAYLGERPALSMGKSSLRRTDGKPAGPMGHGWHQDGAFLGRVRSVNVWIALSDCGVDAAGLDIVARRLPYVMQTGTHGAGLDWTVGNGVVATLEGGGAQVVSPEFAAGDAMMFDHLMLHRTGSPPGVFRQRWAIESWFFAPSAFPLDQGPFVI